MLDPRSSILVKSPAKLNLYLDILRKRKDGYHDIDTLFERISLCDDIILKKAKSKIRLKCDNPSLPCGPSNLAYKAALLLKRRYGVKEGVDIDIKKRIPAAAGLGGASSNAAAVLLGLVGLWGIKADKKALFDIGRSLGADVGFFLLQKPYAIGTERGDTLKEVQSRRVLWHVLVNPGFESKTKNAYSKVKLNCSLTDKPRGSRMVAVAIAKKDLKTAEDLAYNIFEHIIVDGNRRLANLKERLLSLGLEKVHMSGSGPTLFTIHQTEKEAFSFYNKARKINARVALAHTL